MVSIQEIPEKIESAIREHDLLSAAAFAGQPAAGIGLALTAVAELTMRSFRELASQASGREVLWNAAHEAHELVLANSGQYAQAATPHQGTGLVRSVLDDRYHGTVNNLAISAKVSTASVASLVDIVTLVVLDLLGSQAAEQQWNAQALGEWLNPRQPARPPRTVATVAAPAAVPAVAYSPVQTEAAAAPAVSGLAAWFTRRSNTILAVVSVIAAAEFGYIVGTRSGASEGEGYTASQEAALAEATAGANQYAAIPVSNRVAPRATAKTAVPVVLKLKDGRRQIIGASSTESKLYQFLIDPAKEVDLVDPTKNWIGFDRIYFETNKAILTNESLWQLSNIASILKQFPASKLKIGGYTDASGNPLRNLRLSKERAEATRQSLVSLGVPADHLTAVGYGALDNISTNDTEEGRALNRRVSLQVTQK